MLDSFEEKLKSFMNDEKIKHRVDETLSGWKKSLGSSAGTIHERVMDALNRNFEDKLFAAVGEKIAETLNQEGMLDFLGVREKCETVSRLQEDLLQKHLDYAVKEGLVDTCQQDGKTFYCPKKKK